MEGKNITVLDFPGHHRLREGLRKHLNQAGAVIFLVDANAKTQAFINDAEYACQCPQPHTYFSYLYNLFTNEYVNDTNVPFFIACNKIDMVTARSKDEIKTILEKELYVSLLK